jgi:hypothetical protein
MLWYTAEDKQVKQLVDQVSCFDFAGHACCQALSGVFIDDIQYAECSAVLGAVNHEVIAPHMVLMLRPEPHAGAVIQP